MDFSLHALRISARHIRRAFSSERRHGAFIRFISASLVTLWMTQPETAYAGTHAAGNPATGATSWSTTYGCAACHGATPSDASFNAAFAAAYATTGPNNTLAYYAAAPANISTGVTSAPYMGSTGTVGSYAYNAATNQNDISAYFATFMSPVLSTPAGGTYSSGATYNGTITGATGLDYLVSNTTYSATLGTYAGGIGCTLFGNCYGTTVVTFTTSNTGSSATFSGTLPTVTSPTTYRILLTATNANNGTAGTVQYSITVNPPAPVISSGGTASGSVGASATQYTITASNNPTSYGLFSGTLPPGTTLSGASISGTPTTVGTYNVWLSATNAGGTGYVYVTFTIGKGTQTVSFGAAPTVVVAGTGTATATASSGLAVTYSSTTPSQCSVNSSTGQVTGLAAGTNNCTIAANQAGNTNWNAATQVTQTISIGKGSQTISFGAVPTVLYNGTGSASAAATSGLAVTYSTTTPTQCSVNSSSGLVTGLAAGTGNCTIAANQAGDANYNAAAQATQTISIGKADQSIGFGTAPGVVVGGTGTVSATATSGLAVTYSVPVTTSVCSVNASTGLVSGITFGTCTVAANQAGNTNYNAALQATQNIAVGLTPQTITFGTAPAITYPGGGTVTASSSSGLSVTLSSTTPSVCTISGNTVSSVTAGSCTIAANQAGNGTYAAATQATQTFSISQAAQTITFGVAPTVVVAGTGAISATGGASGNAVTFTSQTTGVCTVSGTTVTGVAAGTCTIAANQAGNTNYSAATQKTQSFSVGKGDQTITFGAAPAISVGGTGSVTATASSTLSVTFTSLTNGICTVAGATVTGVSAGTCTIAGNQAGNVNYNAAPQKLSNFSIGKAGQTLSFGTAPSLVVGGSGTLSATSTAGLAATFSSTTTGICTVSGNTVTGVAVGTCTVAANQGGNANYNPATQVLQSFGIGQGSQTITFGAAPSVPVGGTGSVSATASSGLAVTLSSLTTSVCTISGNTVSGLVAGSCVIAADQAGDANYSAAAQATQNITISNIPVTPSAASMSIALNTAASFDLAPYISGTGISGVDIATSPAHGKVTTAGTVVTYTPNQDYFGTDTFTYRAHGTAGISSSSATVTVTITGRPDPIKDARVTGLVNVETAAVKRFGKAQIFNFQQRLESRHHVQFNSLAGNAPSPGTAPMPAGGGASGGQSRGYFNSWQPGTALSYSNDPVALLNSPDPLGAVAGGQNTPLSAMFANMLSSALTGYSLNLGSITNAVGGAQQEDEDERLELWAAGNLRFGTRTQTGVETRFSTDGVSIGADKRIRQNLTLGMGIGYARDKSDIGTDGTTSRSSGNSVAAYGSYLLASGGFIDGLLGYGKVNFDTNRYVSAVNDFAYASRKGEQVFGSFSFGYEYRSDGLLWSPYGRYDFSYDRLKEGTETGAGANALNYASQTARNSQLAFGMRAQSVHKASFGLVQPSARLEYQRGIEHTGQTTVSYADLLGTRYSVAATTQNTNSMLLGLGSEFLLSDTLRFALDYQRLRSGGRENYQSFNFRLTKDLKGKNDFDALLLESYASASRRPSGWMFTAGYAYDDNVSRASTNLDKLSDTLYSLAVNKSKSFELTDYSRITLNGFLDIEKLRTYTGLGRFSAGIQGEYKYRSSGEFGTPTWGVFARYAADQYESELRDGSRSSVGVTLRKPLTDRVNLYTALAENRRSGKSAVFNTYDVSGRANFDYALAAGQTLYLSGEYRKGDIVSSGRSSLAILDISEVLVRDDVFTSSGFYDYRMKGHTILWTLGYNLSFGSKDSLDFSLRRVEATPDKSPSFAAPPLRYIDNQYSISYLMAF